MRQHSRETTYPNIMAVFYGNTNDVYLVTLFYDSTTNQIYPPVTQ